MPALGMLSMVMNFGGNMAGLAGKAWENIETNRRFEKQSAQIEGATKAAQASSGIETIGGASPGAQVFQETQHREFQTQLDMMKRGQTIAMIGGLVGAGTQAVGQIGENIYRDAQLNKSGYSTGYSAPGSTFTPNLTIPSTNLVQSDFVKGALQSGPSWRP
jgi:hypothetical protein